MCEYSTNYLCHYGSKGMKWGQRRWQNADGSLTPAGRVHYGYKASELPKPSGNSEYKIAKSNSKAQLKEMKRQDKIKKAKEYERAWNAANSASEKEDAAWRDVRSQYKSLAKTPIGRFKEVSKAQKGKGSDAANKYLSDWDKAEKLSEESYAKTQEMKKKYEALGRNSISRLITAAKYS